MDLCSFSSGFVALLVCMCIAGMMLHFIAVVLFYVCFSDFFLKQISVYNSTWPVWPSKDPDNPGCPPILIRAITIRMNTNSIFTH